MYSKCSEAEVSAQVLQLRESIMRRGISQKPILTALIASVVLLTLGCSEPQSDNALAEDIIMPDVEVVEAVISSPSKPVDNDMDTRDISAATTTLNEQEKALAAWVDGRQENILAELKTYVEINTGTDNIAGIDKFRNILDSELQQLGFNTEEMSVEPIDVLGCDSSQMQFANHLYAVRGSGNGKRLFLNGHMDTVFSADDEFQTLEVLPNGVLKGPGVIDMKGGLVVLINALRALDSQGALNDASITVFLNSDEEIGSLSSRPTIEKLAAVHDIGLVFEGTKNNRMTRLRKGLGQARIKVTGRESHAGTAHEKGVSANLEMAHKIIELEKLTDYEKKVTVNTGVVSGGEKRNTISGCSDTYIDMRYPTAELGAYLDEGLRKIAEKRYIENPAYPEFPKTEYWSKLHRPAKAGNEIVDQLIAEAMGVSAIIGEPVVGANTSGGGTDGSIAQAAGLPTLDTLGVNGSGAHSSREETTVASVMARTKLAAIIIGRVLAAE